MLLGCNVFVRRVSLEVAHFVHNLHDPVQLCLNLFTWGHEGSIG